MKLLELASSELRDFVDIHIHTTFSDGKNSMEEMVIAAVKMGLRGIAFTDHVWRSSDWVMAYKEERDRLQTEYPDLFILLGLEAKALDRFGSVDVSPENARLVDFVMGVVHRYLPDDRKVRDLAALPPEKALEAETEISRLVIRNPLVSLLGHPFRTFYKFQVKTCKAEHDDKTMRALYRQLVYECVRHGKPIEYNLQVPHCETLLEVLREKACPFLKGSDAHSVQELGLK